MKIQKLLTSVVLSTMLVFSSVVMSEAQAYKEIVYGLRIKGKEYLPEKSISYPDEKKSFNGKNCGSKKIR